MIRAWHFLNGDKMRDGTTAPPDGRWLKFAGTPVMCERGLHASISAFDALKHAPGNTLCLVDCAGTVIHASDKLVCTERRIVVRMDAEPLLRYFARQQALSVIHLYPGEPQQCLLDFLMGDDAAGAAELAAEWAAEWAAAVDAAVAAAGASAWAAARTATRTAAGALAWAAALDAAGDASGAAALDAARSAAVAAAWADFNALVNDAFADWL